MSDARTVKTRKKLIEVALPLEAINAASAREKSIRHGHPSTLHLWWARRPLAAARAVIFGQMVDDPSTYVDTLLGLPGTRRAAERERKRRRELWAKRKAEHESGKADVPQPGPEPTLEDCAADIERQRLFRLVEELVRWENTINEGVLQKARDEIWQSWRRACADNAGHPRVKDLFDRNKLPAFHDPFAGGGALPLEAQRLGLQAYASDLNPVAVLINKAMIEIPPKFGGRPPVNPKSRREEMLVARQWSGTQGLADDVRYYGEWMRDEAEKRIGKLYPKFEITAESAKERPDLKPLIGQKLTVIAWLWARTVKSPNPAFREVDVPLASTFTLSIKPGREAYVQPVIDKFSYRFRVKVGKGTEAEAAKTGTKLGRGANFRCLMSGAPISGDYIKAEGQAGRIGAKLMAIVAEGKGKEGRLYLSPTAEHESIARSARPDWEPDIDFFQQALGFRVGNYGMRRWSDVFTDRQLVALTTLTELVRSAGNRIRADALCVFQPGDERSLREGGIGATAYAEAVMVYLAIGLSRLADMCNALCGWEISKTQVRHLFTRQTVPMLWDFAENNVFGEAAGAYLVSLGNMAKALALVPAKGGAFATQQDAQTQSTSAGKVVSTDPPYYDNVGYADLSDFFYVWLRPALRSVFPDLFGTLTTPKAEELVATPDRHGGKDRAEAFFLDGMTRAMHRLAELNHPGFPLTIYYAFKQSETDDHEGISNTGWETFLEAVIQAGFATTGTWPVRTELSNRMRGMGSNALASSIVLVCRKRDQSAFSATRREFINGLKLELPKAITHLQRSNIAPVDLAQAAIGPGMAIYTRYDKVMDAAGKPMTVREALALINESLDEVLAEQEGDFDADTRWAVAWFEQQGFSEGEFGVAETLSKAKNTSVGGMVQAGILSSKRGKVRLLRPEELPDDWDPAGDTRLSAWEIVHHLVRALAGGESAAAALVAKLGSKAEIARELAYRLYNMCNNKKRMAEALAYNGLVQSFPEIMRLAREHAATSGPVQAEMLV